MPTARQPDVPQFATRRLLSGDELTELRATTAQHEAGHAVMQWLRRMPATAIYVSNIDGDGYCAGSGLPVRTDSEVLITLAGYAVEAGYNMINPIDITQALITDPEAVWSEFAQTNQNDLTTARQLLANGSDMWRLTYDFTTGQTRVRSVDEAVQHYFQQACDLLWPMADLIEDMGERLTWDGRLSARTVAALCREYDRRATRFGSEPEEGRLT